MRITSIQLEIKDQSKAENLMAALQQVDRAPPSDLLILPEIWTVGFFSFDRYREESETVSGQVVSAFQDKAREKGCYLHMGSFVEKEGDNYYNTSLLLSPTGEIAARYRKIHLFGYQSRERQILTAGETITTCETPFGIVGLSTCYDLRF
ncbi:MAG: carbon-nitrogen family hydrolase, partial [SAR324 cluster bacterium]|nr:carbon-nitrogen family hydrolase [SAR324 cluster bacterium]